MKINSGSTQVIWRMTIDHRFDRESVDDVVTGHTFKIQAISIDSI
jgi:hypothetical protein